MRAVLVEGWRTPDALRVGEHPAPEPEPGKLTLDVRAAGCNFFDTLIIRGKYQIRPDFPFSPGGEVAGVVREVGAGVEGFQPGDRVMATLAYGGFAERVNVRPEVALRMPDTMSFEEGAAFPVVYPTAHAALVHRGRLEEGETVLVTAAAGGVGIATIQVAKALGARVIGLAGGAEKIAAVREIGADVAVDYRAEQWVDRVKEATDGRGADVVVENVGGDIFDGCTKCIAWDGRLVVSGFASGKIPEVRVNRIMLKHIAVVGLHLGPMTVHQPEKIAQTYRALLELQAAGKLAPRIWRTYPLDDVAKALEVLGSRQTIGKVVLQIG